VRTETEVLVRLPGVLGSSEEESVGTSGGTESELIQGDGLTTSGLNAGAGSGGESESGDRNLGNREETVIVGDGTDNNDGAVVVLGVLLVDVGIGGVARDLAQRHGRAVHLGHEQAAEDDLVEGRIGTTRQEAVELYEELNVDIVALGRLLIYRELSSAGVLSRRNFRVL
jgi:hypothetical protein